MSRWDTSRTASNSTVVGGAPGAPMANVVLRPPYQHGTIGKFITRIIEDPPSQFVQCIYQNKYEATETVTLLCEKKGDCCEKGCCPKDQFWMAALFVLLAFVLVVFIVGACTMICCYQRSKIKQRREEKEAHEYGVGSQIGGYMPNGYSSYSVHESAQY